MTLRSNELSSELNHNSLVPLFILDQFRQDSHSGHFQAATLFVDMSGFTPLTETLMQHAKDGAEALAEALRAIFAPLVREVYRREGLITLFAGDAFTAIFPLGVKVRDKTEDPPGSSMADRGSRPNGFLNSPALNAAMRAADAAFAIQALMGASGRTIPTRYGDFVIGVKVGLSLGDVRWGIPRNEHLAAFYFRGQAVDGCAHAEQQAEKGEIIADSRFLAVTESWVTATALPGTSYYRLHDFASVVSAQTASQSAPARAELTPFIPQAILDLPAPAEFREGCVVFLSFEEPDDEEVLHAFIIEAMALTDRYGGIVNQIDFGDKGGLLLLLFGAPVAHEDDAARAAECLLALRGQDWQVRWRAGVSFGIVWAGIRGGAERCEYGAAGNVVILASRLSTKADWGAIWTSEEVHTQLRSGYELDALGAMRFKGRSTALPVHRLIRARLEGSDITHSVPLVSRDVELSQLRTWLQPIFDGRFAGVIYVEGEAGIGKSRLVDEMRQRISSEQSLRWFDCPADAILGQSLHPFKYALRTYCGRTNDLAVRQRSLAHARQDRASMGKDEFDAVVDRLGNQLAVLGDQTLAIRQELDRTRSLLAALLDIHWPDSLHAQLDPKLRFENTLAAFKNLVRAEAALQPVILHLEDTHWIDDDSRQLVQTLTRNMAGAPVAIICTARHRDDGTPIRLTVDNRAPQRSINLGYLTAEEVRQYAQQILETEQVEAIELSEAVVQFLVDKTNGNPFFVEQLALDLRERGGFAITHSEIGERYGLAEQQADTVPSTVSAVLMARLDRLKPEVKEIVQVAAVLGREFDVAVLEKIVVQQQRLAENMRTAQREQIWAAVNAVRYLFRHALLRDAAYDMQLRARLRVLHQRAGAAIESIFRGEPAPHYAELAYHYRRSQDIEHEQRFAALAGEYAADQYANDDAIRYLSRALALVDDADSERQIALLLARERVAGLLGNRAAQLQDLEMASGLSGRLDTRPYTIDIRLRQAEYARITSNYEDALEFVADSLQLAAQEKEIEAELLSLNLKGRILWQQGHYAAARSQLQKALAMAEKDANHLQQTQSLYDLGVAFHQEGEFAQAQGYLEKAQSAYSALNDQIGVVRSGAMLGVIHYDTGHFMAAIRHHTDAVAICDAIGWKQGETICLGYLGNSYFDLGDYATAQKYHLQVIETSRELGDREGEAISMDTCGLIDQFLGNYTQAEHYYRQALITQHAIGDRRGRAYTLHHLGAMLIAHDDLQAARDRFTQALHLRQELGEQGAAIESLAGLAQVNLNENNVAAARAQVDSVLEWTMQHGEDGLEFPVQVYLVCYHVLAAASQDDPAIHARALEALQKGYRLVQRRAAQIRDAEQRRTYLNHVPFNREVVMLWDSTYSKSSS